MTRGVIWSRKVSVNKGADEIKQRTYILLRKQLIFQTDVSEEKGVDRMKRDETGCNLLHKQLICQAKVSLKRGTGRMKRGVICCINS